MSGKTNELIKLSKEISEEFNKRELDVLLSLENKLLVHFLLEL